MSLPLLDPRSRVRGSRDLAWADPGTNEHSRRQVDPPASGDTTLPTAAELFVPSLPGVPDLADHPTHPLNLYAGEIPSYPGPNAGGGEGPTGKDARIFFMMAKARRSAGKQRVIFWFNGGPGCSSFDGSLMEVGPFRTVPASQTESGQTEIRLVEGGWEEYATMIFVDQPPGTGFSYIPTDGFLHELDEASAHLVHFMANLYKVFPELEGQETYLAGESFAGQYIPYFADALLKTDKLPKLDLKGIAIGNGWIDPLRQYPAYQEFAYKKELITKGSAAGKELDAAMEKCNKSLEEYTDPLKTPINIDACEGVMHKVTKPFVKELNGKKVCMNIYDVRKTDDYPKCGMGWPPDLEDVYSFLRRPDVVKALHATMHETAWVECNGRVGNELHNRRSPASVHLLPGLLEAGLKVLMFAGAEDLICNNVGVENMIDAMTWSGGTGFGNATALPWSVNGTHAGEWTEVRNLTYAKVVEASHMVGFDVPHVTNDMILRFMDVDFNLLPGVTGGWSSKVGDDERQAVHFGTIKEDAGLPLLKGGSGDWEAWYNAVSAVVILCILGGIVGCYFYFRRRRLRRQGRVALGLPSQRDSEERVPLAAEDFEMHDTYPPRRDKGKGRAVERVSEESEHRGPSVFALGDEDGDGKER
ncbi:putative KEX1 protein precursor [Cutaneotrichosporon oleaginosum]|uniref:Pheromone-processing carboxypeptidase KEX1 n=1 Tax=Cutaneotrichosporon oleaginosum TaxID=879819 RepID=A0A0J0XGT1_9TREE|nr:putative KEX1 protein precursor [Cutaneotrichosporon oleaginosum]KLT40273.1 putative KEX1 protein precursor [Cutaneotrichosporon oleaginosum]